MNIDLANFSTDLRRISYWIIEKDFEMAKKFLHLSKEKYKNVPTKIGCYKNIWTEISKIENMTTNREKASERAMTASVILLDEALFKPIND